MAELTIGQLIKIILGVLVVVLVVIGIYMFFRGQVFDFFGGFVGEKEDGEVSREELESEEGVYGETCLSPGTIVYTWRISEERPDRKECCYGHYCSEQGLSYFCTEQRCCSENQGC